MGGRRRAKQKQQHSDRRKVWLSLGIIAALAILIRMVLPWDYVFGNGTGDVWFRGNDAWYRWRLVENMAANWPHVMTFDPYTPYPYGTVVVAAPLMSWLIVGAARLMSFGEPSIYLLKATTALMPAMLGVLTMVPVFFIGRAIWNRWVGVVAAGLVMLLPSQFLSRSLLGFADHHVLETLLSTAAILGIVLGYKSRKWWWYAFGGAMLGLYFLSWHGAMFILAVLLLWVIVQYVSDMYRGDPPTGARLYGMAVLVAVTLAVFVPFREFNADWQLSILTLCGLAALGPVMESIRRVTHSKAQWWVVTVGIGAASLAAMLILSPQIRNTLNVAIDIALPTHLGVRSIGETKPLSGSYFLSVYAVNVLTAGAAFYWSIKERHEMLLVSVWGGLMLLFTLSQMRWDYYLVVPLALLSGYGFVRLGRYVCAETKRGSSLITLVFLIFATSVAGVGYARSGSIMTYDWWQATVWLRERTPEPFDDGAYYELSCRDVAEYGVLSWWDYGHIITAMGHRAPVANPFQMNVTEVAAFFVDGIDYPEARYVVVDRDMVMGKWYAMPLWLGRDSVPGQFAPTDSPVYLMWAGTHPDWVEVFRTPTVVVLERRY